MRDELVEAVGAPEKGPKKPNILLRFLAFLVTLALVVGAVTLVVYREELNFDALKRQFTYRSLSRSDSGQAESFSHEGTVRDVFAPVDGGLLVASSAGVRLYSGSGVKYADLPLSLQNPAAMVSGTWSLAYDVGGRHLTVFRGRENVSSLTLEEGKQFLSARINASGVLAVVTQESGYKGTVLVYDNTLQPMLQLSLSSSFLMDAVVSADGETLAVVTLGQADGLFESRLELYRMDRLTADQAPAADGSCSLGNNLALSLREQGDAFWVLGENGISAVSPEGALLGSYDYSERYLKEFSLEGEGFAALLLGRYKAGSVADLTVVGSDGGVLGTLPVSEQVLSLSASGRYVAVLTADRLDIYTADLTLYSSLEGTAGARKVLMRSDGTAMLIANDTARLYIPS